MRHGPSIHFDLPRDLLEITHEKEHRMTVVELNLEGIGDGCWPDLLRRKILDVTSEIKVAVLKGGMTSGKSSVTLRIDLDENQSVVAQVSLEMLLTVTDTIKARYGDPRGL